MEVHRRLAVNDITKQPLIKFFSTCRHIINEIPALPLDAVDPEDVDTRANDHSYDALRYGCMSRPLSATQIDLMTQSMFKEKYTPVDSVFGY